MSGAWVRGFELNAFFEGERASTMHILTARPGTELETDLSLPNDKATRVLQIEFTGRKPRCDFAPPLHLIIADRIISYSVKAELR